MLANNAKNDKYIVLTIILGIANLLTYTNKILSLILFFLLVFIYFYLFLKKKYKSAFFVFLISLCMSFEFSDSSDGVVYGFKTFEIAGISICFFLLIPLLFVSLRKINFSKRNSIDKIIIDLLILGCLSFLSTLLCILSNDNNALGLFNNYIGIVISEFFYKFVLIIVLLLIGKFMFDNYPGFSSDLMDVFLGILIAVIVTMTFSKITNIYSTYGSVDTLKTQYAIRYVPFLILYIFSCKRKGQKMVILLMYILGTYLTVKYNATGKTLLMYAVIPFVILLFKIKNKLLLLLSYFAMIGLFIVFLHNADFEGNKMLYSKFNEAASLFKFGDGWLINMPLSPRTRFGEFINILYGYFEKPYLFLFGKGFGGTMLDYTNLVSNVESAYSIEQESVHVYYQLHESLNSIFVVYGFFGIVFLIKYTIKLLKGLKRSPTSYWALFWLWMSFGFSFTLTAFGLMALMVTLYENDFCLGKMKSVNVKIKGVCFYEKNWNGNLSTN